MMPLVVFGAQYSNLQLPQALELAKKGNLELSIATLDHKIKSLESGIVSGQNYGKLDLIQNISRSNDAGNVFGFKLSNREATFRDFGFSDFDMQRQGLLDVQPKDLNYPDVRNYFQTKLQYSLPVFTGGQLSNYKKIKESFVKMASLDREKIEKKVSREVKNSYGNLSLLETFIKNLGLIRANINKLESMSKNMLEEGYAKKVDVLEVKSKKANIIRMINQADANKKLALQYLSFLLNETVISVDTSTYMPPREITLSQKELENSLDLQKAKEGYEMSKYQISLSKAAFLPTAGLMAEYSSSDDTFLGDFSEHDAYTVGVQIKWNLFNGGSDGKTYEKAKIENIKAQEQLRLAKSGIWLKANKLKTEIEKINFDIDSLNAELDLAEVIYENYLGRYQEKLVSINDVIIKQSSQIELVLKIQELQNKKYDKILELEELL